MHGKRNLLLIYLALIGLFSLGSFSLGEQVETPIAPASRTQCELVVLTDRDDPYYPLAEEIAKAEKAPVATSLKQALLCQPIFLLWVVSPDSLSDEAMIEFGLAMKDRSSAVSSGIITASTIEQARALWENGKQVEGYSFIAINAPNPAAHIYQGQIKHFEGDQVIEQALTKASFSSALQSANYVTFTGHGGNSYLRLDENTKVLPSDVPPLDALLISTGSCQTFRLWNEDSIARRFADQGAAAYSGFVFSPNEGYLIGEFDGLPFQYTWPDFPIGHVIQAQNHGTLQGFARLPYQHLLGDPRIALQTEPPYQLADDRMEGDRRVLRFQEAPAGVVPIQVEGGAAYHFVQAQGITKAAEKDLFYNSHLQMVNIQQDKFILLVHDGGDLTLYLHSNAPWYWIIGDLLLDSLDHTLIFGQQSSGDLLALGFSVVPILWVGRQLLKKRLSYPKILLAIAIGFGASVLQGAYVLARLDQITITSKTVVFSPLSILSVFLLSTCGAIIFFHARSWLGRVLGLLVATFISWSVLTFGLLMIAAINLLGFIPEYGTALYNYSLGLLPVSAFLFTFILYGLVFWYIDSMEKGGSYESRQPTPT